MLELVPIPENLPEDHEFGNVADQKEILQMSLDYYKKIGFVIPWIGYFARMDGQWVGTAGFKGKPVNGKIEIAYSTFEEQRNKGIATEICRQMVRLAAVSDTSVTITARTLPENNDSVGVLKRNGFKLLGTVWDEVDGNIWEWIYPR
ncbi:MAG TPA: GNAT family protein [Cyclobacteriaceae bacterium]|nr:GNAT family protein [Cyclobacteriaceae bacterium]